jgi:hypothetical protein
VGRTDFRQFEVSPIEGPDGTQRKFVAFIGEPLGHFGSSWIGDGLGRRPIAHRLVTRKFSHFIRHLLATSHSSTMRPISVSEHRVCDTPAVIAGVLETPPHAAAAIQAFARPLRAFAAFMRTDRDELYIVIAVVTAFAVLFPGIAP